MSQELAIHLANRPQKWSEEDFAIAAAGGEGFLDRVQLMTSGSEKCKAGEFPVNHFAAINGETFKDLGNEFDAIILSRRPKAIEFGDSPLVSHDPKSDLYRSIMERSDEKDSGCMFGTEYLIWVPSQNKFYTFLFGSKSARREASTVNEYVGHGVTFKPKKVSTAKYTWFLPTVVECTSLTQSDLPDAAALDKHIDDFENPKEPEIEPADSETTERER